MHLKNSTFPRSTEKNRHRFMPRFLGGNVLVRRIDHVEEREGKAEETIQK